MRARAFVTMCFLVGVSGFSLQVSAGGTGSSEVTKPESCLLSSAEFSERSTMVTTLLARHEAVKELEDGYTFRFPGDDDTLAMQLAELVVAERDCCSFLKFELSFAPQQGPIWLAMSGSQEVKAVLTALMAKARRGADAGTE